MARTTSLMLSSSQLGRKIHQARVASGMSQAALAARLGRTQAAVSNWESGRRSPDIEELSEIADVLSVDLRQLAPPPGSRQPVQAALRALVANLDQHDLSESLQLFVEAGERLRLLTPTIHITEQQPIKAAQKLLAIAGAGEPPIDVFALAEALGVHVLRWRFSDPLSGLVVQLDGGPVIGVNRKHVPARQRFTVAHELGHYLLRHHPQLYLDLQTLPEHGDPPDYDPVHERDANEFAANLLMPAASVRRYGRKHKDLPGLAQRFGVSDIAMRYRLANLGLR
jgi:Zn-dependent peptidase ImmA (M78 family)/DNA-binding XRE family transcriptional regulator